MEGKAWERLFTDYYRNTWEENIKLAILSFIFKCKKLKAE